MACGAVAGALASIPKDFPRDAQWREIDRSNRRTWRTGRCTRSSSDDGDECVGWCQYGSPSELPNIKNPGSYAKELVELPDWRIGCIFTGSRHRGKGVARAGVAEALEAIRAAGGGIVEAYPEQIEDRPSQRGAYLHTGPESLFADFGFVRDRKIAKWRWVMRREVSGD